MNWSKVSAIMEMPSSSQSRLRSDVPSGCNSQSLASPNSRLLTTWLGQTHAHQSQPAVFPRPIPCGRSDLQKTHAYSVQRSHVRRRSRQTKNQMIDFVRSEMVPVDGFERAPKTPLAMAFTMRNRSVTPVRANLETGLLKYIDFQAADRAARIDRTA